MRRGVTYGVMAGALWGMVYLVPRLLPDFAPLLLGAARCMMYGLVSLVAAAPMARRLTAKLTRANLIALAKLALVGNLVYYVLLTAAVQRVGIGPTSLIVGVLPVTITLAGRGDAGSVPLARLAWPLALIVAGIVCINADVFSANPASAVGVVSTWGKVIGVLCALGALASWTWFAVQNTRLLRRLAHFDSNEWSILLGLATGVLGIALWLPATLLPASMFGQGSLSGTRWHVFWLLNLTLAIGASWIGTSLWNAAAKRLPLTLSGQLVVFDTLFALIYGFAYDARLPRPLEATAIGLLVTGVIWSLRRHRGNGPDGLAYASPLSSCSVSSPRRS